MSNIILFICPYDPVHLDRIHALEVQRAELNTMARKPPFDRTANRSEGDNQKADKQELNRIPAPSVRAGQAKDPVAYGNWRDKEPESKEQMQEWLEHERALILRFLGHWKAKAENDKTRAQKEAYEATLMTEWAKWEPETDVETGEIYNDDRRKTMLQSMISVYKNSINNFADGNSSHNQYTKAQELWEGNVLLIVSPHRR